MTRLLLFLALAGFAARAGAAPKLPGGLGNLLKSVGQGSQEEEGEQPAAEEEGERKGPDVGGILRSVGVSSPQVERVTKGLAVAKKSRAISAKEFSDIGPAEEHSIGRAVSAEIFGRQRALDGEELNLYVQSVGQAVAAASERPETFGGYHFQVLDADEVNALSTLGGFVFVTRGLLARLESEDELACVLAHEVAHVASRHAVEAIRKNRRMKGALEIASTASKAFGSDPAAARRLDALRGNTKAVMDVLLVTGYGHDKEFEADAQGAAIAARAGYDARALRAAIERLEGSGAPKGGLFKTHPSVEERLERLTQSGLKAAPKPPEARLDRFAEAKTRLNGG